MDIMEQLRQDFVNRPEDEKLVMGYLASGNSAHDLLNLIVEYMKGNGTFNDYVAEIKEEAKDSDEQNGDVQGEGTQLQYYLDTYRQLGESINSPIVG